jgi:hypothetical protein
LSIMWSFYSFDWSRWQSIFGSGTEDAKRCVVESVTWDEGGYEDPDAVVRIARQIVTRGFSYEGLSPAEANMLDKAVMGFFCSEGLEECLGFAYESPDGLHLSVVKELIARGNGDELPFLSLLTTGRRLNGRSVPEVDSRYLILTPDEVSQLRAETQHLLEGPARWSAPSVPLVTRNCLLDVLTSVIAKNRCLAGRHC